MFNFTQPHSAHELSLNRVKSQERVKNVWNCFIIYCAINFGNLHLTPTQRALLLATWIKGEREEEIYISHLFTPVLMKICCGSNWKSNLTLSSFLSTMASTSFTCNFIWDGGGKSRILWNSKATRLASKFSMDLSSFQFSLNQHTIPTSCYSVWEISFIIQQLFAELSNNCVHDLWLDCSYQEEENHCVSKAQL